MMSTSKTVVFFGNERLVSGLASTDAPLLRGLIERGYHVAAVVSNYSETQSKSSRTLEVADVATAHGIPVLLPAKPAEILEQLANYHAEVGVLSSYGRIVPEAIINLFPRGIVNLHPSLLPKYRGSTPIESAILNGDAESGVSIMQLGPKMDAGPIFAQAKVPLDGTETKFELYHMLSQLGVELLLDKLPAILDGSLTPTPQDESRATYCSLLSKSDALLDPFNLTAEQADAQVRAYLGFPKTKLTLSGQQVIITKAHVSEVKTGALEVICKDKRYLVIDELVGPSGRTMTGKDFLNGYATAG